MIKVFKLFALLVPMFVMTGCVTSPIDTQKKSSLDAGSLLAMAAGGAAGGFIGNEIAPGGLGAAAGTGIGILGAAILTDAASQYTARQKAEAFEQGKRAARLEVMEQYWYDNTTSYNPNAGRTLEDGERPTRSLRYEPSISEGVRLNGGFVDAPIGPFQPGPSGSRASEATLSIGQP